MAIAPAMMVPLMIAGTGLQVAGSVIGMMNNMQAAGDAKALALRNKLIAEDNAQRSLVIAQEEQFDVDMETAATLGEQEAIQAGSGLAMGSKSFVQTRSAARMLGRIDALNVREAGEIRAQAYRNESDTFAAEALAAQRAKNNALIGGLLGTASAITGGLTNYMNMPSFNRQSGRMSVPGVTRL